MMSSQHTQNQVGGIYYKYKKIEILQTKKIKIDLDKGKEVFMFLELQTSIHALDFFT